MKKLSSMLAISLAMAMTLGMTAFATPSVTTETTTVPDETPAEEQTVDTYVEVAVPDADLSKLTEEEVADLSKTSSAQSAAVTAKATTTLTTASGDEVGLKQDPLPLAKTATLDTVKSEIVSALTKKNALTLADGKTSETATTIKAAFTLELAKNADGKALTDAEKEELLKNGGIKVGFPISTSKDKTYLVLHQNEATGVWENVKTEVYDGVVVGTFTSLSPVAIVEVDTKAGDTASDDDDDDNTSAVTATGAAASPKTAETASVAGVIALAAVATAVVASKKIRYNA